MRCLSGLLCAASIALAQFSYPPNMEGAKAEVYKTASGRELKLYIFNPPGHTSGSPAIVFFFGGGWKSGSPQQFEQQSRYLASRGMVAITADYRVSSREPVTVMDCVRDAKSAIRWTRAHARELGIDPDRIAAGGGSAGGHLAAVTGVVEGLDEPGEDLKVSSRPNALVLFNPVVMNVDPAPFDSIRKSAPPVMIFHGRADTTVPYSTVERFAKKMNEAGNRCELVGFDGESHGFFNYGRGGNNAYRATLRKADEFLTSLGYLKGPPTLQ
jgi:acetyl esterase/lipase